MPTIPVNNFGGGMTADSRNTGAYSQLCKHFDNFTAKHKLVPYRSSEDAITAVTQVSVQLQNFLMYSGNMYALGRQASTAKALIYKNTDIATPSWSTPTNGQDNTYTISDYTFFMEYKGILWGTNSQGLWSYNIGSTTFSETAQPLTFTTITQGIVHSKDSKAYFGYTNATAMYIASKDGSSAWSITALTLPDVNHKIVSICEYGNYLAIGCAPLQVGGDSFVILWDRDSSLNDVSETINLGNRVLSTIENVDGYIIAISLSGNTSAVVAPKLTFSEYGGGGFQVFNEIPLAAAQVSSVVGKQKSNNRLYFGLTTSSLGYTTQYDYVGVWSVGRNSPNDSFTVNMDRLADNDTLPQSIKNFIIVSDYAYISYLDAGTGDYGLSKTDDQATYNSTSTYLTVINPNMPDVDKIKKKQLQSVIVTYEKLPTAGQCVLKYRVDGGSFVTVFTETTNNAQFTEMPNANGTGFTAGRDYEFQLESSGGAIPTAIGYKYITLETQI